MRGSDLTSAGRPAAAEISKALPSQMKALRTLEGAYGIKLGDYGAPSADQDWGSEYGLQFRLHSDLGDGQWAHIPISDDFNVTLTDLVYYTDSSLLLPTDEFLTVMFVHSGRTTWRSDFVEEIDHGKPHCVVALRSADADITVSSYGGEKQVSLTLHCSRTFLRNAIGSAVARAPQEIRAFIAGGRGGRWLQTIPTHPEMSRTIRDLFRSPYQGRLRRLHTEARALELLCPVLNFLTRAEETADTRQRLTKRDSERLHAARELMNTRYSDPPTIAELSRHLAINDYKLKHGFKQLFGTTIFDYCHSVRMERARQLLCEVDLPVSLVAEKVGYRHASSFATAFKAHFGYQPKLIRKKS